MAVGERARERGRSRERPDPLSLTLSPIHLPSEFPRINGVFWRQVYRGEGTKIARDTRKARPVGATTGNSLRRENRVTVMRLLRNVSRGRHIVRLRRDLETIHRVTRVVARPPRHPHRVRQTSRWASHRNTNPGTIPRHCPTCRRVQNHWACVGRFRAIAASWLALTIYCSANASVRPKYRAVVVPARHAYSHSFSVGRR